MHPIRRWSTEYSSNLPRSDGYSTAMPDKTTTSLRLAVIGPSRFGIGEPFAGGLEAHTAGLIRALHERGHNLRVFAGPDGDAHQLPVDVTPVVSRAFDHEFTGRRDTSHPRGFCGHVELTSTGGSSIDWCGVPASTSCTTIRSPDRGRRGPGRRLVRARAALPSVPEVGRPHTAGSSAAESNAGSSWRRTHSLRCGAVRPPM